MYLDNEQTQALQGRAQHSGSSGPAASRVLDTRLRAGERHAGKLHGWQAACRPRAVTLGLPVLQHQARSLNSRAGRAAAHRVDVAAQHDGHGQLEAALRHLRQLRHAAKHACAPRPASVKVGRLGEG